MAQMATLPVFACRGCGKAVVATLESYGKDEDASRLRELMQGLAEVAMCKYCQMRYNWLASQGRSNEFILNPVGVLYNVLDHSGNDYYRKNG